MTISVPVLVTHSGAFHSDELMALALLERFVLNRPVRLVWGLSLAETKRIIEGNEQPDLPSRWDCDGVEDCRTPCPIIRTRDPEALRLAKSKENVWVLDVGGEYQPERLNFDHHQDSMKEQWADGTPYSCAGLVWRWILEQGVSDNELTPDVAQELGKTLIRGLDAHDNGVQVFAAAQACEGFNRNQVEEEVTARQFEKALRFMADVLNNAIYQARTKVEARHVLHEAWKKTPHGQRYVVLDEPMEYPDGTGLLKEVSNGQALLLGLPGKGNRYNLISTSLDTKFDTACPAPKSWRGKMDFQVNDDHGPIRLAFAHKTGFMCVIEGGSSEAKRAAQLILDEFDKEIP